MSKDILIIEDDTSARLALSKALERAKYQVAQAPSGEKGLQLLEKEDFRLVLCDIQLPGINGLETLEAIKKLKPKTMVVMMTAFGTIEKSVKAIKLGALDFVEKPLDLKLVKSLIQSVIQTPSNAQNREEVLAKLKGKNVFEGMVGSSSVMHDVFETIVKVAPARTTVLITGETGSGKELVARALHNYSQRKGPFVAVNLGALPDTLIESELFGHTKGAHSTAFQDRKGRLSEADAGTLFLDEIGDVPENIQVKLLRVLETRSYEKLGENVERKVDVRFLAATNVNLEEAVANNKFRKDLYYRLKVLKIELPPLREHPEDIPLLVQTFVEHFARENSRPINEVAEETMSILTSYRWPGNIRELERVIESSVIMSDGNILLPSHLPSEIEGRDEGRQNGIFIPPGSTMKDAEKILIRYALKATGNNKTKAAENLGIGTRTLYRKIEEYDL